MINAIPFFGWFLSIVANVSLAVPFWFCWTNQGLGAIYFDFLPSRYHSIPFWHCVGLFIIASILKCVLPKLVSVNNSSETKIKTKKEDKE